MTDSKFAILNLTIAVIFLALLSISGCVSNDCRKTPYVECKTVSFKEPKIEQTCAFVEVPYSWKDMVVKEDFNWGVGRFLHSDVAIRNVDSNHSGIWIVRFSFTTLDDGTKTVDVNHFLGPGEEKIFNTEYDLAFSEEYRAEYHIIPPKKEVCEFNLRYAVKETESCETEVKYRDTCG